MLLKMWSFRPAGRWALWGSRPEVRPKMHVRNRQKVLNGTGTYIALGEGTTERALAFL